MMLGSMGVQNSVNFTLFPSFNLLGDFYLKIINMKSNENKRRQFLQLGLGATAGILATGFGCNNENGTASAPTTTSGSCTTTPEQDLGPFYPHVKNGDGDVDLTTIKGKTGQAKGEIILVRGKVTDENCQPIEGALVEIWQANQHGRYSHEGDTNTDNPLDPNFEGWGEMTTKADGSYGFNTIKPGKYAISETDWRTPHIHFKISRRGFHEVVTQMYFEGEKLNETDMVILELPTEERAQFILSPSNEKGIPVFSFNLSLRKVATHAEHLASLDACVGSYDLILQGKEPKQYKVRRDGNQLYLAMKGYTSVELKMAGKDEFLARPISRRCIFNRAADGSVESLTLKRTDREVETSPQIAMRLP